MQKLLYFSLTIYFLCYLFESPIRYALSLKGLDSLIFIRDGLIVLPMVALCARQILDKKLHPAFVVFFAVIGLHGLVMVLNTHSALAVAYSAKVFMGMLFGALAAPYIFAPGRRMVLFFLLLWAVSAMGVCLDKYVIEFPWTGMETIIGDFHVDISRNWEITGEAKRAAGFMRSSINAAMVMPLIAFMLLFHCRSIAVKAAVGIGTLAVLYWTTQKGSLVAYAVTLCLLALGSRFRFSALRAGFFCFMILMVALPLALPGYHMPQAQGVFSINSFALRVEEMWPEGWRWIARNEVFPFGIGIGGLGGGQRMWSADDYTAGDNLYLFMYGNFGLLTFGYLTWLSLVVMRLAKPPAPGQSQAMATLAFLMGYGCVLSLIEDQMALVFSGAAMAWIAGIVRRQDETRQPHPAPAAE